MARLKLTKNVVGGLSFEKDGQWVTDTEVPQLVVRLAPTSQTYVGRWTSKATGKRIQTVIAPCGAISVDEARDRARKLVAADTAPTVDTLSDIYKVWDDNYSTEVGFRHAADFRSAWKKHIEPTLGRVRLARLTSDEIQKWYRVKRKEFPVSQSGKVSPTPYSVAAVNRWVAYLSKLCTIAQKSRAMVGNPCDGLEKSTPLRRVTIFIRDDVKALADNLDAVAGKYPIGVALIRFLMMYPCRGIEARRMQWDDLDLKMGTFTVPADRYKTRVAKQFPLGPIQIAFLETLPRRSEKYVFPSPKNMAAHVRYEYQRDTWAKVRPKKLGAHTLRKTIGSDMLNGGMPLEIISKLLGHSSTLVTQQVYAHLSPATAARHLAMWGALTDDDLPEQNDDEKQVALMLQRQATVAINEEYEP